MKSKSTAFILCLFLGWAGAHQFYLGKTGKGIFYLFTVGFFLFGWIIDIFTIGGQVDNANTKEELSQIRASTHALATNALIERNRIDKQGNV